MRNDVIVLKFFDLGTEHIECYLKDMMDMEHKIKKSGLITELQIKRTKNKDLENIKNKIINAFPDNYLGENTDTLSAYLGELLKREHLTLCGVESCTGGMISADITSISGSSLYFKGSVIAYSNEIKEGFLSIDESILERYGSVSSQTALKMAKNVKKMFNCDISYAVTGIAGPSGGSNEKPIGLVYIAVDHKKAICKKYILTGNRVSIRKKATDICLFEMIRVLR